MKILLDPGHGSNTHGKRSPDGRFLEYRFNRDIALDVQKQLTLSGYDATILVPEDYDVSIRARTERVNTWCRQLGKKNVCLISIHTNAAGNGRQWMNARGWCCYTSRGQTAGDRLATCLYEAASLHLPGHKIRKDYSDGDPDWESDFTILKNTLCAPHSARTFSMTMPMTSPSSNPSPAARPSLTSTSGRLSGICLFNPE